MTKYYLKMDNIMKNMFVVALNDELQAQRLLLFRRRIIGICEPTQVFFLYALCHYHTPFRAHPRCKKSCHSIGLLGVSSPRRPGGSGPHGQASYCSNQRSMISRCRSLSLRSRSDMARSIHRSIG